MKSVRLLPVVILAATALLLFKGLGLVTSGGYVLTGATTALAAGGGVSSHGEATLALPAETTLSDPSPTLGDVDPTMPLYAKERGDADAHGEDQGAAGHGGGEAAADLMPCPPEGEHGAEDAASSKAPAEGFNFERRKEDCAVAGVNEAGDSLPTMRDGGGNIVPLAAGTSGSEEAVAERLGARREALDEREAELEMRLTLVETAEKRLAERTAMLEALEARVNALVEEKKAADDVQFRSIVAMYETMKPKEAAAIFDQLEMPVLLRVASAMAPRKMAGIMAKMEPSKAKDLTAEMAVEQPEPDIQLAREDLSALPQIVGQ